MTNKSFEKMSSIDLNLRQYFFIDTHDFEEQSFLINQLLQIC